jgi:shikimate dehydrogenase
VTRADAVTVPRRCAVLGSPVAHSLSPVLHRAAYEALGLAGWEYTAVECDEAGLPGFLEGLDDSWAGLSLTMPLKRVVLPLCDEVSEGAAAVGAVNTLVLRDGRRRGDNTDVPGLAGVLTDAGCGRGDGALVLGGGATACSALAALAALGAGTATLAVRDAGRAAGAVEVGRRLGLRVEVTGLSTVDLRAAPLVVSTLPAGAGDPLAAELGGRPVGPLVDVVYAPWPTPLARAWKAAGGRVVGGLEMLVRQAALQVTLFTGQTAPVDAMRRAGEAALAGRPS